jgi:hypothetical protein
MPSEATNLPAMIATVLTEALRTHGLSAAGLRVVSGSDSLEFAVAEVPAGLWEALCRPQPVRVPGRRRPDPWTELGDQVACDVCAILTDRHNLRALPRPDLERRVIRFVDAD